MRPSTLLGTNDAADLHMIPMPAQGRPAVTIAFSFAVFTFIGLVAIAGSELASLARRLSRR